MLDLQPGQQFIGLLTHRGRDLLMPPQANAAEKSGQNRVAPDDGTHVEAGQVVRHDSQQRAQFGDVPGLLPEKLHRGTLILQRVKLTRDGFDQRRFTRAVRTHDGDVLAGFDA
jgi:hypothetical protein